jgi:adenosylcobinamide-GDP ribazoletransferase
MSDNTTEPYILADKGPGARCLYQLRLFFIALQFFTRIPIPRWVGFDERWLAHASRYFPAVGLVVGLVSAAVYVVGSLLWTQSIAVVLAMIASIYLTGSFHEDGFADTCDGFGGGLTSERVLEIMKDSRIGVYGAVGIGLLLALKWMTLSSLPSPAVVAALLLAHPLSRLLAISLVWRMNYAKANGKAKPMGQQMSNREFCIAGVTTLLVLALPVLTGILSVSAIAAGTLPALLATLWLARKFQRRIDGYTGDCLGAVQQLTEVVFYLGMLAALAY